MLSVGVWRVLGKLDRTRQPHRIGATPLNAMGIADGPLAPASSVLEPRGEC